MTCLIAVELWSMPRTKLPCFSYPLHTFALAKVEVRRYYKPLDSLTAASPAADNRNNGFSATINRPSCRAPVGCIPAFVENCSRWTNTHLPVVGDAYAQAA